MQNNVCVKKMQLHIKWRDSPVCMCACE